MPLIFNIVDMICLFPKGNVSRDLLLQKISSTAQLSEAIHWGPACNRAVREIFPDTLAQRKGKFKKYPFHSIIRSQQANMYISSEYSVYFYSYHTIISLKKDFSAEYHYTIKWSTYICASGDKLSPHMKR